MQISPCRVLFNSDFATKRKREQRAERMTTQKKARQGKTLVALGAITLELCVSTKTSQTSGVTGGASVRPKFQILLVNAGRYPGKCAQITASLGSVRQEDLVCTVPLKLEEGKLAWPPGTFRGMKIKGMDRFGRNRFCVRLDQPFRGTQFIRSACPGMHVLLEANETGTALLGVQLAFEKAHLGMETWKNHISVFYSLVPRKKQSRSEGGPPVMRVRPVRCALPGCNVTRVEMELCPCGDAYYCSPAHATQDWTERHHRSCTYTE
jgi:hypothetical protein